jgi:molecular chaperone GrpE (heat shock protein)
MVRRIQRWIWEGSFDPELEKLDLLDESGASKDDDLLERASATIRGLQRSVEDLQESLERRRRREHRGHSGEASSSEEEVKKIARSMLPSLDALDRLISAGEQSGRQDEFFNNWLRSIHALQARLIKTLEEVGLAAISSVGAPIDLEVHDVVSVVPATGDFSPNTVAAEQVKGYYFRGKLLRDAKVVVAQ